MFVCLYLFVGKDKAILATVDDSLSPNVLTATPVSVAPAAKKAKVKTFRF